MNKTAAMKASYRDEFHHVSEKNADGTPLRVRVNGKCKLWKTRPNEFALPVKHGLYDYGKITHNNCDQWTVGSGR